MLSKKELQLLGLDENTSLVYIDCLRHKQNTPTNIARRTGLKRTTLYSYLERLKTMGLLFEKVNIKRKYYHPFPIKQALANFQKYKQSQLDEYSQSKSKLQTKLDALSVHGSNDLTHSIARYYGDEGMLHLADTILKINCDTELFGPTKALFSVMDEHTMFQKYSMKRMDSNRRTRDIIDSQYLSHKRSHLRSPAFSEVRILEFPEHINALLAFSGDHCALTKKVNNQPEAIVFQDKEYVDLLRFLYDQLWETLPKTNTQSIKRDAYMKRS